MKAVVAAFNQEKALVRAFSVITNLRIAFVWISIRHTTLETFPIRLTIKCQTWGHWQWNLLLMTPPLSVGTLPILKIIFYFNLPSCLTSWSLVWGLPGKIWLVIQLSQLSSLTSSVIRPAFQSLSHYRYICLQSQASGRAFFRGNSSHWPYGCTEATISVIHKETPVMSNHKATLHPPSHHSNMCYLYTLYIWVQFLCMKLVWKTLQSRWISQVFQGSAITRETREVETLEIRKTI